MALQELSLLILLAPLAFVITALFSWFQPGRKAKGVMRLSTWATILTLIVALAGDIAVVKFGLLESGTLAIKGMGLSVRLDPLSMLMLSMIAILGFVIIRYSQRYLEGDARHGAFIGRMSVTIASVQLLVLAGNLGLLFLAWVLTSLTLHNLLVFYKDRPRARIAARKKFIVARLGDACLLGAIILLYQEFGTGNLEAIFNAIKSGSMGPAGAGWGTAAVLIAFAALLKSAQFPTHGWLVEVMETPTPVSALLHAGLLNAGPFLITRMAFVVNGTHYAPVVIILFAGFTALFSSVVHLTQPSVKTSLGYSSSAHMGFSLLACGLGVYPAAMLHLVAHSFYKAHAFLSSGSVIEKVRAAKVSKPKRKGSALRIVGGFVLAFVVYVGFALLWGIDPVDELALLATGAIVVMGLSQLITTALDSTGTWKGMLQTCLLAIAVATAFFSLEESMRFILTTQLPGLVQPNVMTTILIAVVLVAFGATVIIQILAPVYPSNPFWRAMGIHFRNGWYANALFDRMIGALRISAQSHHKPELEWQKISQSGHANASTSNA